MGHREARFYAELAPSVALRVPEAPWPRTTTTALFALFLEDLGTRLHGLRRDLGDHPRLGRRRVEELADLHARFDDPARAPPRRPGCP